MKLKNIFVFILVISMMVSMVIGVSASSDDTVIRDATSGTEVPGDASASVAVEGIIEPTLNTSTDNSLKPTDPSKTSSADSGWEDPVVSDTSQLLVSAPAKMKFVVRGRGAAVGDADLVDGSGGNSGTTSELVSGTIKNASAYIPADNGLVVPKEVAVTVSQTGGATSEFALLEKGNPDSNLTDALSSKKGAVKGVGIQLETNTVVDFGAATTGKSLGNLAKGLITTDNAVYPSSNTIAFVNDGLRTAFESEQAGRLVNDYNMTLTFSYIR